MNATASRRQWLLTAALAGLAVGYFAMVYFPEQRAIAERRNQVRTEQDHLAGTVSLAANLVTTQAELDETRRYIDQWHERTPNGQRMASLLGEIHALAKRAGVTPMRFEPQPGPPLECFQRITVNFGCACTYAQLHEFLRQIEGLTTPLWVDSIQIKKAGEAGQPGHADVVLVVFAGNSENSN